jgi:hypothetical protein
MTLSFHVSDQDITYLFGKVKKRLKQDSESACQILQDLVSIAQAFKPEEMIQASNFQTKYLEINRDLLCQDFSRYDAQIKRAIEEIICSESHVIETRTNPPTAVKMLISIF